MAGPEDRHKQDPQDAEDAEDLFEDLDKFFAPIQDPDWPETEVPAGEGSMPTPPAPGSPGADETSDVLEDWAGPQIDLPPEEEMLGQPSEPSPPPPEPPAAPPLEPPAAPPVPEPPAAPPPGEPEWRLEEEEGAGDEWERFRDSVQAEAAATGQEQPEPAQTGELSVEDMAASPPQYAGLPGPEEDESLETMFGPSPEDETPPSEEPTAVTSPPETAGVEAAAEHFAEGIRESPEDVERELLSDLEEPSRAAPGTIRIEPGDVDAPPPPAWEEPAITPEEAERAPAEGRNLPAAVISGALLAVAAVALLAIGKGPFAVLAALVILAGQAEIYAVMRARGSQPATALGLVVGALLVGGAYAKGEPAILFALVVGVVMSVFWYVAAPARSRKGTVANIGATLLGILYVPFLASFALLLLRAPGSVGRNLLFIVVGLTVLYDICAYGIGTLWGSRPLAPTVSPKKSWEGVIGATFILLLVALALIPLVQPFAHPEGADSGGLGAGAAVGLALVIAVAAPLGDLAESALKRDFGVKDMGTLLPGHGGILDRIDSILFTAPAAWYFIRIVLL